MGAGARRVAVLGAGAWGTAFAVSQAAYHEVTLWARKPEFIVELTRRRRNDRYLPTIDIPASVRCTDSLASLRRAELLVAAVSTSGFRSLLRQMFQAGLRAPLVWLCKGFETGTVKLPHEVAAEEWPEDLPRAVLSGPSFAREVALGLPTAVTLAGRHSDFVRQAQDSLHTGRMRVYTSSDVIGVEVGGAVKNVIAIAAGIADGLNFGHNARAALITRGLAEVTRLGMRLGGRMDTFMGLSGLGDLVLTCTGDLSRNRQVGLKLAQGQGIERILRELGHVAEGVTTAGELLRLAEDLDVDMPIVRSVGEVLFSGLKPLAAVEALLHRDPRPENG